MQLNPQFARHLTNTVPIPNDQRDLFHVHPASLWPRAGQMPPRNHEAGLAVATTLQLLLSAT